MVLAADFRIGDTDMVKDWLKEIRTAVKDKVEVNQAEAKRMLGHLAVRAARTKELTPRELNQVAAYLEMLGQHADTFVESIKLVEAFDRLVPFTVDFEERDQEFLDNIADCKATLDEAHATKLAMRGKL